MKMIPFTRHTSMRRRLLAAMAVGLVSRTILTAAAAPQPLLHHKDLTSWRKPAGEWMTARAVTLEAADPTRFVITPGEGILVNGPKGKTTDLVAVAEFGDAEVHVEFCIPQHSNSGVYLMGRYEVQIYDSFGAEQGQDAGTECGGIYPRWINGKNVEGRAPRLNVCKPPGEWQSFDILFRAPRFDTSGRKTTNARFVMVQHNGTLIHQDVEVSGPTRAAMFADETSSGPLLLQGDHGPVAYRNVRVRPADLK